MGVVPEDGTPIQFYGRSGNSSHDTLLSESVPVELHNRSFKIEFIFPDSLRLDAPDEVCRSQAQDLGIAEIKFGVAVLKPDVFVAACKWLREHPLEHDIKTMQGANLQRANLQGADLQGSNLRGANLWGANLQRANLQGADLQGSNLRGANLRGAALQGADLWGADLWEADLLEADMTPMQRLLMAQERISALKAELKAWQESFDQNLQEILRSAEFSEDRFHKTLRGAGLCA